MGISDRRKRETETLRNRVLEAAEEIIAREGAQQVTMRRIAASVDYAPTVLYRLFANKDDLMDHLIARGYGGVWRRYDKVLRRRDLKPLQTLERILKAYFDYALGHPNHYRMWFETGELSQEGDQLKMTHGRLDFAVFQPWLDCIEACRLAGYFPGRDRFQVFQLLWPRMHGLISLRLQHPKLPWPSVGKHLKEVLDLTGLGARS